jgi:hypothetical protein
MKETGNLEQDSSVVIAIFNPFKHLSTVKTLKNFMGFNIEVLKGRFRCLGVLKNRHGKDNVRVPLAYYGEAGAFESIGAPPLTKEKMNEIVSKKANINKSKK